jgi:hypothetical protein
MKVWVLVEYFLASRPERQAEDNEENWDLNIGAKNCTLACMACWLTCMASSWARICVRKASVAGMVVVPNRD